MTPGRVAGAGIYRPECLSEPLDQTDLKEWRRCNLGGGGEPTFKAEADWWDPQAGRPTSGAG